MKRSRPAIFMAALAAVSIASVLFGYAFVYSQWKSYHDFTGRCLDCHLTEPKPGDKLTFVKNISFMCRTCHREEQGLTHPVDMKPSMPVPSVFPLDWKGDLTCVSCHPVHQPGMGPYRLRARGGGEAFCVMCHSDLGAEIHRSSVGTAHFKGTGLLKFVPGELYAALDELSIKCMACHDAVFAKDTAVENKAISNGLFHTTNDLGLSHPIGVSYLEAKRLYKGAYKPVESLPKEIRLFGGVIGCATCHNPYSKQHSELVMSNEGSRLCLSCHVK